MREMAILPLQKPQRDLLRSLLLGGRGRRASLLAEQALAQAGTSHLAPLAASGQSQACAAQGPCLSSLSKRATPFSLNRSSLVRNGETPFTSRQLFVTDIPRSGRQRYTNSAMRGPTRSGSCQASTVVYGPWRERDLVVDRFVGEM